MSDFQKIFGRFPVVTTAAPGRVNLIGEHTDYNGGFVLPTGIPQHTRIALAPRTDDLVRVASPKIQPDIQEYRLGQEKRDHHWVDYVQGITRLLRDKGCVLHGFEACIDSDVPVGSGLSSSAALEVSLMKALREVFHLNLADLEIALLGQRCENEFVGARVGVMDPMASSLAEDGIALFIDSRSLAYEKVPLPAGAELVVISSGISHRHSSGDYNTRRAECERACALLGIHQLRDLGIADLPRVETLPEPMRRRSRHVITENQRVLDAVAAIKSGDLVRLGQLFYASHGSQRDDYQVSIPEIDLLIDLTRDDTDVYGARLTGGGFGGSVVLLVKHGAGAEVAPRVARAFAKKTGEKPRVLVPTQEEHR